MNLKVQLSEAEGQFPSFKTKRSFFICSRWHLTHANEPLATANTLTWEIHQDPGILIWVFHVSLQTVESSYLVQSTDKKQSSSHYLSKWEMFCIEGFMQHHSLDVTKNNHLWYLWNSMHLMITKIKFQYFQLMYSLSKL